MMEDVQLLPLKTEERVKPRKENRRYLKDKPVSDISSIIVVKGNIIVDFSS